MDMERGFLKYQHTTCHPHAHSPRPEVLQEVPVQLLRCEHSSSHSRMEHRAVTPPKGLSHPQRDSVQGERLMTTFQPTEQFWANSQSHPGATQNKVPGKVQSQVLIMSCSYCSIKNRASKFRQRLCELVLFIGRLESIPEEWKVFCLIVHRRDWEASEQAGLSPFPVQCAEAEPVHPETFFTEQTVAEYPH